MSNTWGRAVLPEELVGSLIGGYLLEELIGMGGMGAVYRATGASAEVALKVMLPELATSTEFRERFLREAEAPLHHPNVVRILDAGEDDGVLYIAMELVRGPNLKTVIREEGRLMPAEVVAVLAQAARGLDAAHENGIVHRDVKPQNILIGKNATSGLIEGVFLSDFGLVKRLEAHSQRTDTGYLLGTLQYMAPEQIEGKEIDGRADLYALGCVAFEALTGEPPFATATTEVSLMWAHIQQPPPLASDSWPVLSDGIDSVLATAMAKSPVDRFATAGEFAGALSAAAGIGVAAPSPWSSRRPALQSPRLRAAAAALASPPPAWPGIPWGGLTAAAAVAALILLLVSGGLNRGPIRERLADAGGGSTGVAPATDDPTSTGSSGLVGGVVRGGKRSTADEKRSTATGPATTAQGDEQDPTSDAREGSGGSILQDAGGQLGAPVARASKPSRILFRSTRDDPHGEIYSMKLDGSDVKRLTRRPGYEGQPAGSPDGRAIAFTSTRDDDSGEIYVMDADGSDVRRLTFNRVRDGEAAWSPDGSKIAFTEVAPGSANEELGKEIFLIDATGRNLTRLTSNLALDAQPAWSPDGRQILFTSERTGDGEIWVMGVDGSSVKQLTMSPGVAEGGAAWSPDGSQIAFTSLRDGQPDIYIMDQDGVNVRRLTSRAGSGAEPKWLGGSSIIFSSESDGNVDIAVLSLLDGVVQRLTRGTARDSEPSF
jgi:serine/threonine-protein kinase